jgi:tetratricopeptide (TPR) repeat protein
LIPNTVHFVWLTGPNSREFSFINYLAVRAAHTRQEGARVLMHVNAEPVGNINWERIRPYVEMVGVDPPTTFNDYALTHVQYQSDVLRLQILLEHGGIYLDTDMLLIRPVDIAYVGDCVLSPDTLENPRSINAGIIMAAPGSPFIRRWLDAFEVNKTWAFGAVVLPWELIQEDDTGVVLTSADDFLPFGWKDKSILTPEGNFSHAYCVHMWETIWGGDLNRIDDHYLRTSKSEFARLFREYAWKPKICVYAISKNEEMFVNRFCKSAADADMILIADTGSTDGTVALAKANGAYVPEIYISPWRFDLARNAALSLIPKDVDICVSLDLDEELQPGWREEIERVWSYGTTRLKYKFDWGVGIVFYYEKIHGRSGYKWHHPCHEYPVPDRITELWARTDMLLVIHKPDPTKSRGQYLDLLRISIEEDPTDPRNAFYYARELSFSARWHDAIAECKRYLALPGATWDGERCYAMRVISRSYQALGNTAEALNWARRATAEAPNTREPWCEVAMLAFMTQRWPECYGAAISALAITDRELVYTCDPAVWEAQPHDLASIAAWHLGLKAKATEHAECALAFEPDNERLKANLAMMQDADNVGVA